MKILEISHLSKVYGKDNTLVKALDNVSFSVEKGEFVAITGPSGSGKSTLLHILGGVDKPTEGRVVINGTDISELDETALAIFRRRQIGLIYQFYNLIPILTVEENLTLPLLLDGRKPDRDYVTQLLKRLGLAERIHHLPNQLSGGQQQRVAIGRALITKPKLILADEPTGNLDSKNSQDVIDLLTQASRRFQQTILMITHNKNLTASVDRVFRVTDGVLTDLGGNTDEALS